MPSTTYGLRDYLFGVTQYIVVIVEATRLAVKKTGLSVKALSRLDRIVVPCVFTFSRQCKSTPMRICRCTPGLAVQDTGKLTAVVAFLCAVLRGKTPANRGK